MAVATNSTKLRYEGMVAALSSTKSARCVRMDGGGDDTCGAGNVHTPCASHSVTCFDLLPARPFVLCSVICRLNGGGDEFNNTGQVRASVRASGGVVVASSPKVRAV